MTRDELIKELEALRTENQRLHEENEALRKEVAVAQEQVATAREVFAQLTARIERLEGRVAKDSHHSSRPTGSRKAKDVLNIIQFRSREPPSPWHLSFH